MSSNPDIDRLVRDFNRAGSQVKREMRKTVFKGAQNVKKRAQYLAPNVKGADQISFEIDDTGDDVTAEIETRSGFGAILEYGGPNNPGGRPYMLPALRPEAPVLEQFVGDIIDRLLP